MNNAASATNAVPLANFHARVRFADGTVREIDLWPYVNHGGIFEAIRSDPASFAQMIVENGAITWPNGADIDPDVLYYNLGPNATEEAWQAARAAAARASRM